MARKMDLTPHGLDVSSMFPEVITKHDYKIVMEYYYSGIRLGFYMKQRDNNKWYSYEEVDDFCGDLGLTHEELLVWTLKYGTWLPRSSKDSGIDFDDVESHGFKYC